MLAFFVMLLLVAFCGLLSAMAQKKVRPALIWAGMLAISSMGLSFQGPADRSSEAVASTSNTASFPTDAPIQKPRRTTSLKNHTTSSKPSASKSAEPVSTSQDIAYDSAEVSSGSDSSPTETADNDSSSSDSSSDDSSSDSNSSENSSSDSDGNIQVASVNGPLHQYSTEDAAQAHCPDDTVVWLNTNSGIYHEKGMRWYGNTRVGAYVCRQEANDAGDRDTRNGQ